MSEVKDRYIEMLKKYFMDEYPLFSEKATERKLRDLFITSPKLDIRHAYVWVNLYYNRELKKELNALCCEFNKSKKTKTPFSQQSTAGY